MKRKQPVLALLLLLFFSAGLGGNLLFASTKSVARKSEATVVIEKKSESGFFFFEPLGDNENEENGDKYLQSAILAGPPLGVFYIPSVKALYAESIPDYRSAPIWQLLCNFRI